MRKRNLQKAVVLLVCFAFLGLSASGLSADPQKTTRLSFSLLLKYPAQLLVSLFPGLGKVIKVDEPTSLQPGKDGSIITVKPIGTIKSIRLSGRD
jgi:hypothetical protein